MTVTAGGPGGNRNSLNKPLKPSGQRDWSFGIFDCFGACGTCLFSWCCSCLAYGKNTSRLAHLNTQGTVHPVGGDMVKFSQSFLIVIVNWKTDSILYAVLLGFGS